MTRRIILASGAIVAALLIIGSVMPLVTEVKPAVGHVPLPKETFILGMALGLMNLAVCVSELLAGRRQR